MEKVINLTPDFLETLDTIEKKDIYHRISGGPKKTKIILRNPDTGEILQEVENKVVISGSIFSAMKAWGIDTPVILPNYNEELQLDHTLNYANVLPKNDPVVCLFCVGDSGCGTTSKDVFTVKYTGRIDPFNDIMPFRYQDIDDDLNDDLRKYYFGRKTDEEAGKIAYYFKAFETTPMLHLRYTDGTQITDEMYNVETEQGAECYVETKLRITRNDFRDYFEQVRGWDKARISTISLCYAWYDDTIDDYRWYQQIYPYTKLHFSAEELVSLDKAIEFQYSVYY